METPIENLDLSVRVFNSLKRTGITTVGNVLELLEKGDEAVMSIRNFGEKSLDELRDKMLGKRLHEKRYRRVREGHGVNQDAASSCRL
jgi:DNA-directed RNA polymerase subunit alpha (EC 2.7.7.6)